MAEAEAPAIPKQELLYCERFVELLTDMLSQVCRHTASPHGFVTWLLGCISCQVLPACLAAGGLRHSERCNAVSKSLRVRTFCGIRAY